MAGGLAKNPLLRRRPDAGAQAAAGQIWQGWNLVTYPDQPVWSNTVRHELVAGESLSSCCSRSGDAPQRRRPRRLGIRSPGSDERERFRVELAGAARRPRVRVACAPAAGRPPFVLPYLPFLIVFGIVPMVYAV